MAFSMFELNAKIHVACSPKPHFAMIKLTIPLTNMSKKHYNFSFCVSIFNAIVVNICHLSAK